MSCWDANPSKRPSFGELAELLGDLLQESTKVVSIDLIY